MIAIQTKAAADGWQALLCSGRVIQLHRFSVDYASPSSLSSPPHSPVAVHHQTDDLYARLQPNELGGPMNANITTEN